MPIYDCTLWEMLKPSESGIILSLEERISIICKSLDGLIFLQENRKLHLDIKPSNIMLRLSDDKTWDQETLVLTDFGLATNFDILSGNAGTPGYGSPEQFLGRPSKTSDNFAIGKLIIITIFPWNVGWNFLRQPITDENDKQIANEKNLKPLYEMILSLLNVCFLNTFIIYLFSIFR